MNFTEIQNWKERAIAAESKLAEIEKQEPIGDVTIQRWRGIDTMINTDFHSANNLPDGTYQCYALPVQPLPALAVPDGCYELMSNLASTLYSAVNAGKLNEGDIVNFDGKKVEISTLLDQAERMLSATTPPSAEPIPRGCELAGIERLKRMSGVEQSDSATPYVYFKNINGKDEWSSWNTFSDGSNGGKPLYENITNKPQRITEQDVREIIKSYMQLSIPFKVTFESWISAEGRALLAKLNEHREPDYKATNDDDLHSTVINKAWDRFNAEINREQSGPSFIVEWVEIDSAEDAPSDGDLVLWDGCDLSIDYVETEVDFGTSFFANGTGVTHYLKGLTPPAN